MNAKPTQPPKGLASHARVIMIGKIATVNSLTRNPTQAAPSTGTSISVPGDGRPLGRRHAVLGAGGSKEVAK
jgi:hypothetical protein